MFKILTLSPNGFLEQLPLQAFGEYLESYGNANPGSTLDDLKDIVLCYVEDKAPQGTLQITTIDGALTQQGIQAKEWIQVPTNSHLTLTFDGHPSCQCSITKNGSINFGRTPPISERRNSEPGIVEAALWLREGELGSSSKTMCKVMYDLPKKAMNSFLMSHPHDPSDFRRCKEFLDAVPGSRDKLSQMSAVSLQWKGLVERWDEIETSLALEMTDESKTYPTYKLIRSILDPLENRKPFKI